VTFTGSVLMFLGTVAAISVTGVMMPGPVTAAAIAKGYRRKWAGVHIALGHAVVEFPTIALIAAGFSTVLSNQYVSIAIGILGGAMLMFMGGSMILSRRGVVAKLGRHAGGAGPKKSENAAAEPATPGKSKGGAADSADPFPYHPFVAGVLTTASNPYYFLWWATLGAALTLNALELGLIVLVLFAVIHWSIDLGWDFFLSYTVHQSRGLWNDKTFIAILAVCGAIMLFFGVWFASSAVLTLMAL
jgi:threonine/homoserine/homoserine lactone efflux protein